MSSNRVIILAGGKGTRLYPYTITLPKPLVPVGSQPILEHLIKQLSGHGFNKLTLAINHFADLIRAFCGDGSRWNISIDYTEETKPLGTMGPLWLAKDLPDHFLVMNGDILTDLNYRHFWDYHVSSRAIFTIATAQRTQKIDYGVLQANGDELSGFLEKPVEDFLVSTGIYAVSRRALSYIPEGEPFGFDQLMLRFLEVGEPVRLYRHKGYWLDIGRPDDFEKANLDIERLHTLTK